MKIEFENTIRRLSFLCRLPDIKIAWINPRCSISISLKVMVILLEMFLKIIHLLWYLCSTCYDFNWEVRSNGFWCSQFNASFAASDWGKVIWRLVLLILHFQLFLISSMFYFCKTGCMYVCDWVNHIFQMTFKILILYSSI